MIGAEPKPSTDNAGPREKHPLVGSAAIYLAALAAAGVIFLLIDSAGRNLEGTLAPREISPDAVPAANALGRVLIALTAVMATGRVLGLLFRYIGQPPVIGEVVSGILLGPSLLGRAWPAAGEFVLPRSVGPYLEVIAQLGVILYMFVVGLEVNLGALRQRLRSTIAIAHGGIAVPFLCGTALALMLYPRFAGEGVGFTGFALFVGISTSITAFPVLARILSDRRMQRTPLGTLALGCAAVGDVTAWCLLAFVAGIARSEARGGLIVIALTVAFIAFMIVVVRPILHKLLALHPDVPVTPNILALVLGALLLSALTAEAIGIHALFGAFLLGAVIPSESKIAEALTHKLEELVTLLFLPAFFAFTGMRTRIDLVSGAYEWLLCGWILVVATAGKFGATTATARLTGLDWRNSVALGLLMNTRGLMELIALNMGLQMGILTPTLFAMMMLMALATTLATSPLLQFFRLDSDPSQTIRKTYANQSTS